MPKKVLRINLPDRDFFIDVWEISVVGRIEIGDKGRWFYIYLKNTATGDNANKICIIISKDKERSIIERYRDKVVEKWAGNNVEEIKFW